MTRPQVVLVGPPGAGKSTVGRILAARLGVGFRDTDADVVEQAGKPINEIFFDDGEPAFRTLERAAVLRALGEHDGVLSLGGGAVLADDVRTALQDHCVVLLEIGLSAAARRTGLSRDRPVLALNPRAQLRTLLTERKPLYDAVATHRVGTDSATPEQVADQVFELIKPSS